MYVYKYIQPWFKLHRLFVILLKHFFLSFSAVVGCTFRTGARCSRRRPPSPPATAPPATRRRPRTGGSSLHGTRYSLFHKNGNFCLYISIMFSKGCKPKIHLFIFQVSLYFLHYSKPNKNHIFLRKGTNNFKTLLAKNTFF